MNCVRSHINDLCTKIVAKQDSQPCQEDGGVGRASLRPDSRGQRFCHQKQPTSSRNLKNSARTTRPNLETSSVPTAARRMSGGVLYRTLSSRPAPRSCLGKPWRAPEQLKSSAGPYRDLQRADQGSLGPNQRHRRQEVSRLRRLSTSQFSDRVFSYIQRSGLEVPLIF